VASTLLTRPYCRFKQESCMLEDLQTALEKDLAGMGGDTFREDENDVMLNNLGETQVNIPHKPTDKQVC